MNNLLVSSTTVPKLESLIKKKKLCKFCWQVRVMNDFLRCTTEVYIIKNYFQRQIVLQA
jgi:hypothetical protein